MPSHFSAPPRTPPQQGFSALGPSARRWRSLPDSARRGWGKVRTGTAAGRPGSLRRLWHAGARRSDSQGFALPLVIVGAVLVSAGALALANRSGQGMLGSIYQGFSLEAHDAAEIGMTRIISELNKPQNRGLLRSKNDGSEPSPLTDAAQSGLWRSSDLALHTSRCPGVAAPDLSSNPNIGYPSNNASPSQYNELFIQSDGSITATRGNAIRSYRLTRVERGPQSALSIYATAPNTGMGTFTMEVEGRTLQSDGTTIAISRLRRSFDLVPKCCFTSFGGSHGNVNYAALLNNTGGYISGSVCLSDGMVGLGILGGTGMTTGMLDFSGGSNSIDTDVSGVPITNVYCLADSNGLCNHSGTFSTNSGGVKATVTAWTINPRPSNFPPAKTYDTSYCVNVTNCTTALSRPPANATDKKRFTYCIEDTWEDPLDQSKGRRCKSWAVNADAETSKLPNDGSCYQTATETHCNVSNLDYKSTDVVFLTKNRQLRLYFGNPSANANDLLIDGGTGGSKILHCKEAAYVSNLNSLACTAPAGSVRDLAMFGCNTCSPQYLNFYGTPDALNMFAYFPNAEITLNGNPTFRGVMWTNIIHSTGNVNWIVPGAGMREVMEYMGMLPQGAISPTSNPPMFDYVARATSRFRWLSN